ncbi:hypothetical protein RSOLAG22IIIB_05640 [Rhizoctonia solani]|uniref:C2H2-type domain-containing protein n=1 Tax=Rhizoctonia solani TaxID=456999 RepID=A0A0K6G7N1_9AGAM|nr:hypothetical protein RSOLAG22IIIB_05640 [Rhizoctonia solani]
MLASSSLHHFSTREPSHIAHEYSSSCSNSNSHPSSNLNLALCSARPSTDAVPRPFLELAPSRYHQAPALPPAPTRALSGLPDGRAPPGGTKHPLDNSEDGSAARRGSIARSYSQPYPPHHSQLPAHRHSEQFLPAHHSPASAPVSTHDDSDNTQDQLAGAYLPPQQPQPAVVQETMTNLHHPQYPSSYEQEYISRAPSVSSAYNPDDRRVSVSSAGSYEHAYPPYANYAQPRPYQPGPARGTPPMMSRTSGPLAPYDYPVESWVGRRPSAEQSPVPQQRAFEDYPEDSVVSTMLPQQALGYPQLDHQSPMQSLGSSSSNSTGIPASPDQLANGLVAAMPEGATPPSATNPGQRTYAFVSLAGSTIRKRPRRRYDEIERLYACSFEDCTKAYGTLNHLNAHVTMQKHGAKRNPSEFKELRKLWRNQKKAEQVTRPRGKRHPEDDHPHALHRTASGSYSSPGAYGSDESDDGGTPQPGDSHPYQHGQVDQMWSQMGPEMGGRYDGHPGMQGYGHGPDPHGHGMGVVMSVEEGTMDRIPPDATLLQSLPPTHPSQQQYSNSMHHSMGSYGQLPAMSGNPGPALLRRASEQSYDYPPPRPSGPPGQPGPHGPHGGYSR